MFDIDELDTSDGNEAIRPHYKSYLKSLSAYEPLTSYEQTEVSRDRLWMDTCKLVLYVFHLMRKSGQLPGVAADDMDVIQEGNIAVGKALPTWNPAKGALSTFLVPRIRGALLNYVLNEQKYENGMIPISTVVEDSEDEQITLDEILEYPDAVFLSPERSAFYAQVVERVRKMPPLARNMLESYFFLDESVGEIADRYNTSQATVYRAISWALDERFWRGYLIL